MKYLFDTNFLIGIHNFDSKVAELLKEHRINFKDCAVSVISYLELLGFSGNTDADMETLEAMVAQCQVIQLTKDIQQQTIALRRAYKIKLPDSIILATAQVHDLKVLTFDHKLIKYSDKTSKA